MTDSEEDFILGISLEIRQQAIAPTLDLLPAKSRKLYENCMIYLRTGVSRKL